MNLPNFNSSDKFTERISPLIVAYRSSETDLFKFTFLSETLESFKIPDAARYVVFGDLSFSTLCIMSNDFLNIYLDTGSSFYEVASLELGKNKNYAISFIYNHDCYILSYYGITCENNCTIYKNDNTPHLDKKSELKFTRTTCINEKV